MEKRNEALRNKQLEIITDDTLKRNLEIQFSQERTLVDLRLKKESERLHIQAKDYESNLRNNFQQRQERFINKIKEEKSKQSAFDIPNEKQFHEDYLIKFNFIIRKFKRFIF